VSHPPHGQQPYSTPPPDALLKFTVQGNIMTSNLVPPTLTIDGFPASTTLAGTKDIPIMSGRHHLQAHSQWMRRYGQAELIVDISPGQTVEVFYAPPYHQFTDGAMGLTPQPRKGTGFLIIVLLVPVLVVVFSVIAAVLLG
jgi:hypothetical protein